jgi:hypothetical protein
MDIFGEDLYSFIHKETITQMYPELTDYIIQYYSHLMSHNEKQAHLNIIYLQKTERNESMRNSMTQSGWILHKPEYDDLLKEGYSVFFENVAKRILRENEAELFLNLCPKCQKLARTPLSKQCRFCFHSWH